MSHATILFVLVNITCLISGVALGVALESWRRNRR